MDQQKIIKMIDEYKNKMINPVEMLDWVWLRVIINSISPDEWEELCSRASEIINN